MNCIKCGGDTRVIDSRPNQNTNECYRKHECKRCGEVFYSLEFAIDYDGYLKSQWLANNRAYDQSKRTIRSLPKVDPHSLLCGSCQLYKSYNETVEFHNVNQIKEK